MAKVWLLKKIDIFKTLDREGMKRLAEISRERTVRKGTFVFREEDRGDCIYLLKSGKVKLSRFSSNGRELVLGVVEAGEVFGEEAIAGENRRTAFAEAIEDSLVCSVPVSEFTRFLKAYPNLAVSFAGVLTARLEEARDRMEDFLFRSVAERLACFLVESAEKEGGGDRIPLPLRLTHQQIASRIGSTRETVTSLLGNFKRRGMIEFEGRRLVVTDLEGLRRVGGR